MSDVSPWSDLQLFVGWLVLSAARRAPLVTHLFATVDLCDQIQARARDLARARCKHPRCRTCQPWGAS